jgi:hypothetical protein
MFWIRSVLPTEVPPNFLTIIAITILFSLRGADVKKFLYIRLSILS